MISTPTRIEDWVVGNARISVKIKRKGDMPIKQLIKCTGIMAASWLLLFACSESHDPVKITEISVIPVEQQLPAPALSTPERMGMDATSMHAAITASPKEESMPIPSIEGESNGNADTPQIQWDLPAEWQTGQDRPMRLATFVPQNAEKTECALTLLSGEAGGLNANINRWRAQYGLDPWTDEEIAALPRWSVLESDAVVVSFSDAAGEQMLLGLICSLPTDTLFVKMTGPTAEMIVEQERFEQFCHTLRWSIAAPDMN